MEKYFKTLFILTNQKIPKSHKVTQLHKKVLSVVPRLALNIEFLELVEKAYGLRYPDDLSVGYNIAINETAVLAELDHSVFEVRKGFSLNKDGKPIVMRFDEQLRNKAAELIDDNCYFGSVHRPDLFSRPSRIYEFRVLDSGMFLSADYETDHITDDGKFAMEALKPPAE